jgi:hypothetical protein
VGFREGALKAYIVSWALPGNLLVLLEEEAAEKTARAVEAWPMEREIGPFT